MARTIKHPIPVHIWAHLLQAGQLSLQLQLAHSFLIPRGTPPQLWSCLQSSALQAGLHALQASINAQGLRRRCHEQGQSNTVFGLCDRPRGLLTIEHLDVLAAQELAQDAGGLQRWQDEL